MAGDEPPDLSGKYNTPLTPQEEIAYQAWGKQQAPLREGRNPAQDTYDYDMRGFWKAGNGAPSFADNGHAGDTFKKPNHPTFSTLSQYHGADGNQGGTWGGGQDGKPWTFTPSQTNLKNYPPQQLQRYFKEEEPDNTLVLPTTPQRRAGGGDVGTPSPSAASELDPVFDEAGERFGVDPNLLRAQSGVESGGNRYAISPKGAAGLMQVEPDTYAQLRQQYPDLSPNPFHARSNIMAGAAYLRQMHDQFGPTGAVAAYNAGPGKYQSYLNGDAPLPDETQKYVSQVSDAYTKRAQQQAASQPAPQPKAPDVRALIDASRKMGASDDEIRAQMQKSPILSGLWKQSDAAGIPRTDVFAHFGLPVETENKPAQAALTPAQRDTGNYKTDPKLITPGGTSPGQAADDQRNGIVVPDPTTTYDENTVLDRSHEPPAPPLPHGYVGEGIPYQGGMDFNLPGGQRTFTPDQVKVPGQTTQGAYRAAAVQGLVGGLGQDIKGASEVYGAVSAGEARPVLSAMDTIDQGNAGPAMFKGLSDVQKAQATAYLRASAQTRQQMRATMAAQVAGENQPGPASVAGQRLIDTSRSAFPIDPSQEGFGTGVVRGAAGAVPMLGAIAAGTAVGGPAGGIVAGSALIGTQSFDSTRQDALSKGAAPEVADRAATESALANMGIMALPVGRVIQSMPAVGTGVLKAVQTMAKNGVEFGSFNALSQFVTNYVKKATFDPDQKLMDGTGQGAAEGFVTGLLFGVPHAAAEASRSAGQTASDIFASGARGARAPGSGEGFTAEDELGGPPPAPSPGPAAPPGPQAPPGAGPRAPAAPPAAPVTPPGATGVRPPATPPAAPPPAAGPSPAETVLTDIAAGKPAIGGVEALQAMAQGKPAAPQQPAPAPQPVAPPVQQAPVPAPQPTPVPAPPTEEPEPFEWATAKVGDRMPDGRGVIAGKGMARPDAQALSDKQNGTVWADGFGPDGKPRYGVVVPEREPVAEGVEVQRPPEDKPQQEAPATATQIDQAAAQAAEPTPAQVETTKSTSNRTPDELTQGAVSNPHGLGRPTQAVSALQPSADVGSIIGDLASAVGAGNSPLPENLSNPSFRDTKPDSDLAAAKSVIEQALRLIQVPTEFPRSDIEPLIEKAAANQTTVDTKLFGNVGDAYTIRTQGFSALSLERQRVVERQMIAALHDPEIFWPIVKSLPVDMVNVLGGKDLAADLDRGDQSMFLDRLSTAFNDPVGQSRSRLIDTIATHLPVAFASRIAERLSASSDAIAPPGEGRPAVGAHNDQSVVPSQADGRDYNTKGVYGDHNITSPSIPRSPAQIQRDEGVGYNEAVKRSTAEGWKPPAAAAVTQTPPGALAPVGDAGFPAVRAGERLRSKSGRELSPVPKFTTDTNRTANIARTRLNTWLLTEARKEAAATRDTYVGNILRGLDVKNFSQSDRDMASDVLWGDETGPKPEHRGAAPSVSPESPAPTEAPTRPEDALANPNWVKGFAKSIADAFTRGGSEAANAEFKEIARLNYLTHAERIALSTHGQEAMRAAGWKGGSDEPAPSTEQAPTSTQEPPPSTETSLSPAAARLVESIERGTKTPDVLRAIYAARAIQDARNFSYPELAAKNGMPAAEWEAEQSYRMVGRGQRDPARAAKFDDVAKIADGIGRETDRLMAQEYAKHGVTQDQVEIIGKRFAGLSDKTGPAVEDALKAKYGPKAEEAPGTPPPEQPEAAAAAEGVSDGSQNKFFTQDRYEAAKARLKERLNRLSAGFDPGFALDGLEMAGYHVERGLRKFADYAKAMIEDLGDRVIPHLDQFYTAVRKQHGFDTAGMDDDAVIAADLQRIAEDTTSEGQEAENGYQQLDQPSAGPLAPVPADEVQGTAEGQEVGPSAPGSGGNDTPRDDGIGEPGLPGPRSVGDGQGTLPVPAGGEAGEGAVEPGSASVPGSADGQQSGTSTTGGDAKRKVAPRNRPAEGTPAGARGDDFAHTDADEIGTGGAKAKYRGNVAAIRLLRDLDAAYRPATREEQTILSKWVGWGALADAFTRSDGSAKAGWDKEVAELRGLLTQKEYQEASASSRNAHYTSPEIVKGMWGALQHMGFNGGRLLEPSVGIGNFFGLMPKGLRTATALHGVEKDPVTSGLAKYLYPNAKIARMPFQQYLFPEGHFDAVIGNPPFGSEKLYDPQRRDLAKFSIHNYFFARSVDGLKPGGVMAMVVTNRLMDGGRDEARKYLSDRADLVGAIRLPNDAFKKNAGTEVTTDIMFFRKRMPGEESNGVRWTDSRPYIDRAGKTVPLNEYFHAYPEMMLGEFGGYGTMRGPDEPALVARPGQDTAALLHEVIARLPKDIASPMQAPVKPEGRAPGRDVSNVRVGSVFADGKHVMERLPDIMGEQRARPVEFANDKAAERVRGMIDIRDALTDVRLAQIDPNTVDRDLVALRKTLNAAYDKFVKVNGPVNIDANKRLFREDPSWPQVSALEDNFQKGISETVAAKTGEKPTPPSAKKAAIFTSRTQSPYQRPETASSAQDALAISLSERGRLDLDYMRQLYRKSDDTIISELGDLVYNDPQMGFTTRDEYLSGNVKLKLAQALEAATGDPGYQRNVDALQAIQPADVEPVRISVKPGATWLPRQDMRDFASEVLGQGRADVSFNPATAKWTVNGRSAESARTRFAVLNKDGNMRADVAEVITAAANQQPLVIYDSLPDGKRAVNADDTKIAKIKIQAITDAFEQWIWRDDERRERLARLYNDTFNTNVKRQFDGSHMTLPGKVGDDVVSLRPTQMNGAWRIVAGQRTLLDHVVGSGKTFTMVAGAMELRRTGFAKKPMIAVPNHLVGQWAADFSRLYPNANVLAASKDDFKADRRKRLFARIATGDWDSVIVPHSSLVRVEVEPSFVGKFVEEQIHDLEQSKSAVSAAEGKGSRNVKKIEDQIAKLREKMKRLLDAPRKDNSLYWGELGVDALMVDECFPWETPILTDLGWLPIGRVVDEKLPVLVLSRNMDVGTLEWKPITRWIPIERRNNLVKVHHHHGHFTCTEDHKVWTQRGYVDARSITPQDDLFVLSELSGDSRCSVGRTGQGCQAPILFRALQDAGAAEQPRDRDPLASQHADDIRQQPIEGSPESAFVGPNAPCKPDGEPNRSAKDAAIACWADVPGAGGQWSNDQAAGDASAGSWSAGGVPNLHSGSEGQVSESAELLQSGLGKSGAPVGDRGGRQEPSIKEMAIFGHAQDGRIERSRVERIEVYERGCAGEPGSGSGRDTTVYDIEVAGNHNFFAAGVLVSNCHEFKNLAYSTSMGRVAGLGDQKGSQKAFDLFVKTRHILESTGGRNVVFATGTPISNTMAEMFTMQRYLDYDNLKQQGMSHFDAWARQFGQVTHGWELSPAGTLKMNSRFSKFVNLPELMQRYMSFADVINRDDINESLKAEGKTLPVPKVEGGRPTPVINERSPQQAAYIGVPIKDADGDDTDNYPEGTLIWRSENLPKGPPQKGDDNMLKIMSDARKAALDMRLIEPSAPDNPNSKVNTAVKRIKEIYDQWRADKGAQLVFCDLSTPKNARAGEAERIRDLLKRADEGDDDAQEELDKMSPDDLAALDSQFSVYDDMKAKLISSGIPANEIAFIHDAKTDLQKEELFGKVRSGRVRVLLGSTSKMGAGMNVQPRLVALHHMDAPWRPSDLEQREGRIIRQGNLLRDRDPDNFAVKILRYATKDTLDARMWQVLESKANFIEQVRKGASGLREAEDVSGEAANSAEMKAASSGNPLILEEMDLRRKVKDLDVERQGFLGEQYRVRSSVRSMESAAQGDDIRADQTALDVDKVPKEFGMTIDGIAYDKRADAGAAITKIAEAMLDASKDSKETRDIGSYGGFKVLLEKIKDDFRNHLQGEARDYESWRSWTVSNTDPGGLIQRVTNLVNDLPGDIERYGRDSEQKRKEVANLQSQMQEWPKEAELSRLKARHAEVIDQLQAKKKKGPATAVKAPEPDETESPPNGDRMAGVDLGDAGEIGAPPVSGRDVDLSGEPPSGLAEDGRAGDALNQAKGTRKQPPAKTAPDNQGVAIPTPGSPATTRTARWPKGGGAGFRDLTNEAPESGHEAAGDWVTKQGRATGHEHIAVVDNKTGEVVHAGTNGDRNIVDFTQENTIGDEGSYTLHHNHPNSSVVSNQDIAMLANPGISHVVAHGHDGNISGVSLGPRLIRGQDLTHENLAKNRATLLAAYDRSDIQASDLLWRLVDADKIARADAKQLYPDVTARLLQARGVIDYTSTRELPDTIAKAVRAHLRSIGYDAGTIDRSTNSIRYERRDAGLHQATREGSGARGAENGSGRTRVSGGPEISGDGSQAQQREGLAEDRDRFDSEGQGLYSFPGMLFDPATWRRAFDGVSAIDLRKSLRLGESSRDGMSFARKVADETHYLFSPTTRSAEAGQTERIIRNRTSLLARESDKSAFALDKFAKAIDKLPVDQQLEITDRVERGVPQPLPEIQLAMNALKAQQEIRLRRVQSIGRLQDIQNSDDYMGRLYSNYPEWKAAQQPPDPRTGLSRVMGGIMGKQPIQGRKGFLKERTFDTLADAMRAGLIPVTTNPIRMQLLKMREMDQFYHGTRMADELKASGIARWYPASKEFQAQTEGMKELRDPYFQPKLRPDRFGVGANGAPMNMRIDPGKWYAPVPAADVFNNYVSRGPAGNSVIYDVIRKSGNMLNSAQLSLSGFHATFVTLDSVMSHLALGLQQIARAGTGHDLGSMSRLGSLAKGISTVAKSTIGMPAVPIVTGIKGYKLRRAWFDPANATPEMRKIADMMNAGGGRSGMDPFYRTTDKGSFVKTLDDLKRPDGVAREMWQMLKDSPLLGPVRIAFRLVDTLNEPIMGQLVPLMKQGVFADMASDYLSRHPDATPEEASEAMTKAWDSVENRMGQMTYDNAFYHKRVKDIAFLTTRSVGWNQGTIREIGGGAGPDSARFVRDIGKAAKAKFTGSGPTEGPDFTARMAYPIAMTMVTAMIGAALTYLMTGHGPQQMMDYFYPPTGSVDDGGEPNRLSIPGYIKDVIAYKKDLFGTLLNKIQPLAEMGKEIYTNRDYYGGSIYDPKFDSSRTSAYAEYLMNEALPFSIRATIKNRNEGESMETQMLSFWGIQPAPQSIVHPEKEEKWQAGQDKRAYRTRLKEEGKGRLAPFSGE